MNSCRHLCLFIFVVSAPVFGADFPAIWSGIERPAMDASKIASVKNVVIERDRIRISLEDGALQFTQPLEGLVFGAAFRGRGSVQVLPPNPLEEQQARLFLGDGKLQVTFTEGAFFFTDQTFADLSGRLEWGGTGDPKLGDLLHNRLKEGEDVGAEMLPRIFKGILSADRKRTAFFFASLKTEKKGWVDFQSDALNLEEVRVGQWASLTGGRKFDTWMEFPAAGRSPFEAWKDPLARADFLIRAYSIDASAAENADLAATARVSLDYRAAGERVALFALDSNLRVDSVKNAKGDALAYFQPRESKDRNQSYGDYVAVVLPEATPAQGSETLQFHYAGKRVIRKVGGGNYFCESFGWYPAIHESFAARSNFEINFRSPKKFTLVATGSKTSETTDGNLLLTSWKSDAPLAVAGFAFGDYKIMTDKIGEIQLEIYANKQGDDTLQSIQAAVDNPLPGQGPPDVAVGQLTPASMAKPMLIEVGNNLKIFENYFGPFPYKKLAVTNIPYSYGQGWPSLLYLSVLSFLDSTQRHSLGIRDQVRISDFFRAHETSHQWWGHKVGWKSYHDQWLSEGFAQFSGNLYVQFRRNTGEYLNRLRIDKRELLTPDLKNRPFGSLGPIWMGHRLSSADSLGAYSTVVYNKGGWVLHMLRMMMWDTRSPDADHTFKAMMQEFTKTYDNRAASTEDFKAIAEKYAPPGAVIEPGRGLDWFFRQYVYGTGMAQYRFDYSVEAAGEGKWKVSGTVAQENVPDGWRDYLPLYMQSGGKTIRLGGISVSAKATPFEALLPIKPEKLLLNANEDVLADVKQ